MQPAGVEGEKHLDQEQVKKIKQILNDNYQTEMYLNFGSGPKRLLVLRNNPDVEDSR